MGAEYEELKQLLNVVQKDLEVTDRNYHLTWQDLQKVTNERNQVSECHSGRLFSEPPIVRKGHPTFLTYFNLTCVS